MTRLHKSSPANPDVAVVGGGPVGLAVAIHARLAGLSVAVFDQRTPPIDKACGEGVLPSGITALGELGVEAERLDGFRFGGIRYRDRHSTVDARFSSAPGLGLRRTVLHEALVDRAGEVGAELFWKTRVLGLVGSGSVSGLRTTAGDFRAGVVVGADGLYSRTRGWLDLPVRTSRHRRVGLRRHFAVEPWGDMVEVLWSSHGEAYVTPVGANRVGVAILSHQTKGSFEDRLAAFPDLERRLAGAETVSSSRGAGPLFRIPKRVTCPGAALVGDAAGYVDAISGEGLALGFAQARALVSAVESADLSLYERAWRRLVREPFWIARSLLVASRFPRLRRVSLAFLTKSPSTFPRLVNAYASAEAAGRS